MVMYNIFFDMDGVLADFDKFVNTVLNDNGVNKPSKYLTEDEKVKKAMFWTKIITKYPKCWLDFELIAGIKEIIENLSKQKNIVLYILSSIPSLKHKLLEQFDTENYQNIVKNCKIEWLKKNNLYNYFKKIFLVDNDKINYMINGEKNILIDDRQANINDWKSNEGIGILFQTAKQLEQDLKEIIV